MRKRRCWRYYCEYCDKAGCSAGHMRRHERGCTGNPDRVCGMHARRDLEPPKPAALVARLRELFARHRDAPDTLQGLREAADGCPACMLAAIRQSKLEGEVITETDGLIRPINFRFEFREERDRFWSELNDREFRELPQW